MHDEDNPLIPLPNLEGERRKEQDRRHHGRSGKYDRRKNRCVNCLHYAEEADAGKGLCRFHQVTVVAYAFACPNFEPLKPDRHG